MKAWMAIVEEKIHTQLKKDQGTVANFIDVSRRVSERRTIMASQRPNVLDVAVKH